MDTVNKIRIEEYKWDGPSGGTRYRILKQFGPRSTNYMEICDLTYNELVQLTADLFTFVNVHR